MNKLFTGWHVATFEPVTLFSLRPANATTAGSKTLISPTPYALKMALLNVIIQGDGVAQGESWFPRLRDLQVALRLPEALLVVATFQRIRRPTKKKDPLGTGLDAFWQSNIAFREYVHFAGALTVAVREPVAHEMAIPWDVLFSQINYLGKRGSFMQFVDYRQAPALPWEGAERFTRLNPELPEAVPLQGVLQLLDDCGPEMTFAHANIYDSKRLQVGKPNGRLLNTVVLPYRMATTARGFTRYDRLD